MKTVVPRLNPTHRPYGQKFDLPLRNRQQEFDFRAWRTIHAAVLIWTTEGEAVCFVLAWSGGVSVLIDVFALFLIFFVWFLHNFDLLWDCNCWCSLWQIRLKQQEKSAHYLANWLTKQPAVSSVKYIGLKTDAGYRLNQSQSNGSGCVISFETSGCVICCEQNRRLPEFTCVKLQWMAVKYYVWLLSFHYNYSGSIDTVKTWCRAQPFRPRMWWVWKLSGNWHVSEMNFVIFFQLQLPFSHSQSSVDSFVLTICDHHSHGFTFSMNKIFASLSHWQPEPSSLEAALTVSISFAIIGWFVHIDHLRIHIFILLNNDICVVVTLT